MSFCRSTYYLDDEKVHSNQNKKKERCMYRIKVNLQLIRFTKQIRCNSLEYCEQFQFLCKTIAMLLKSCRAWTHERTERAGKQASKPASKRQWEIMCTNCIWVGSAFQCSFVAFSHVIVILLADILRSNSGRFYKHIDIRYYTIIFV